MALVYTSDSGAAGDVIEHPTANQSARVAILEDLTPGESIPPGTYVGQPAVWDGAAWVPLSPGDSLRTGAIGDIPPGGDIGITAAGNLQLIALDALIVADATVIVQTTPGARYVSGVDALRADHSFYVDGTATRVLQMLADEGHRIAFFGVEPANQQEIEGTTEQEQIDSIVLALVNLGLAVDGR